MAKDLKSSSGSFQGFVRLGPAIRYYDPDLPNEERRTSSTNDKRDPGLLILCPWMFAAEKHITKYVREYRSLFPQTRILLFENAFSNMMWRSDRSQMRSLWPAVAAIKDYLKSCVASTKKPLVFVHVFSNGGTHGVVQLSQAYYESTGEILPISALVMDSSPSLPSLHFGLKALGQGLPKSPVLRLLGIIPLYLSLIFLMISYGLGLTESPLLKSWRVLNESSGAFVGKNIPRSYIFSAQDTMIPKENVLKHAALAREAVGLEPQVGAKLINCVEFVGSQHVNHFSLDPERYWKTIRETWDKVEQ